MIKQFIRDEEAQDIVEFSLLLVLIGAAGVFILTVMGQSIGSIFSKIAVKLDEAAKAIADE